MFDLKTWMEQQGLNNSALARRMGVSYELVYKIVEGQRPVSDGFKWRFSQTFGADVAESIFGNRPQPEPAP